MIASVSPAGVSFTSPLPPEQTAASTVVAPPLGASIFAQPTVPSLGSDSIFTASYAPEIYTVYLNGLLANGPPPAVLETNLYPTSVAEPPIIGNPVPNLPGAPPVVPSPQVEGVQQIVFSIAQLAGRSDLVRSTSGTVPTVTGGTAARQSSASSRSTSHVTTK